MTTPTYATDIDGNNGSGHLAGDGALADGQQAHSDPAAARLANGLGWFSIGLGLTELLATRQLARMIGVPDTDQNRGVLRALGMREIASGLGILTQSRPAPWLWSRVGGDAMDLTLLGVALKAKGSDPGKIGAATAAVLGVTALDLLCSVRLSQDGDDRRPGDAPAGDSASKGIRVTRTITVDRPAEEVYGFWRNFENLPRFMHHLESVQVTGDRRSHWKAKGPAGTTVEWDAETTDDRPNALIAWRSVEGADVSNAGTVRFTAAPGGRGTEVHVDLHYDPPGGKLGAVVAKLFGEEPGQQVAGDLRRFKQVLETGEVVYSDATIHRGMHPAQPPAEPQAPRSDRDQRIVAERSADAANRSSNLDRESTTATGREADPQA